MELWRRLILLLCLCIAVWLAKYADLSPVILIETIDFRELQTKEERYMGKRMPITEEKQRLLDMPLTEYTEEKAKSKLFQVEGREWEEVLQKLTILKEDSSLSKKRSKQQIGEEWSKRLPSDQYPGLYFFFKPDEAPVNSMNKYLAKKYDEVYISMLIDGNLRYLKLQYRTYSDDDFHFGTGFSSYHNPPTYMLFPYRQHGLYVALFGLLLYIFIPVPKRHPDAISYPRWRIVMGDIVALLMIVPFFSFPFLIVGGSLQTFTQGWPFLIMFWPISFLGIWLLIISAWFAGFSILMMEDRLVISTYKGGREFFYKDMEYFQPVIFKPPKWLIFLTWTAALSGRGSVGRAMILSGSASGSIGIRMKNKAEIFINITDQMGGTALKGFEKILQKLKENGIQEMDEVREIRSMGLEIMR